jgi:hypothetical protein
MAGCEDEVKGVLESAEEIRRSRSDEDVLLFYRNAHNAAGLRLQTV